MDLNNNTPFPHLLFRTGLEGDKFAAAVIVRVTYDVKAGVATPSEAQTWQLSAAPWESKYGPMQGDLIYKRGGVDIMVFGSAIAPNNQPTKRMEVRLLLPGKIDQRVRVIGDRVWESGFLGLGISEPKPFATMPLSMANAYGGWDEWDQVKFPYSNNPLGKGFIWEKANAAGRSLPNIENPQQLIAKWSDRPNPAGLTAAPMNEQRVKKAVEFDAAGEMKKFSPLFYNAAFPELIAHEVKPGEEITVEGMSAAGVFKFKVPEHKLSVNLTFDEKAQTRPLYIDQIGLEPNDSKAFITYRYAFNYVLKPLTKRQIDIIA